MKCHCGFQRVGDHRSVGRGAVRPADVPAAAGAEAGALPAGPEETTRGADEDDGQRGHVLHAADAVHLHLQVGARHRRVKTFRAFSFTGLIMPLPSSSILGMHLFGCKFSFRTESGDTIPDRKNFDSLLWAIVTVFQVGFLGTSSRYFPSPSCPFARRLD